MNLVLVHWQRKRVCTLVNTLVFLPTETLYRGTPKHYSIVKVLEQVYYTVGVLSSVSPPAGGILSFHPMNGVGIQNGVFMKGPALFLAQFAQDSPPYNTLENITQWAKDLGFLGVQIPAWDTRLIDLDKAAESKQYCDDLTGRCNGLAITVCSLMCQPGSSMISQVVHRMSRPIIAYWGYRHETRYSP